MLEVLIKISIGTHFSYSTKFLGSLNYLVLGLGAVKTHMVFEVNVLIFFVTNKCGPVTPLPGINVLVLFAGLLYNTHSLMVPAHEAPYDIPF